MLETKLVTTHLVTIISLSLLDLGPINYNKNTPIRAIKTYWSHRSRHGRVRVKRRTPQTTPGGGKGTGPTPG